MWGGCGSRQEPWPCLQTASLPPRLLLLSLSRFLLLHIAFPLGELIQKAKARIDKDLFSPSLCRIKSEVG